MSIFPDARVSRRAVLASPALAPHPCAAAKTSRLKGALPLRPLGWAGLLFCIPADYRLAKVEGAGPRGRIELVDDRRVRLLVEWRTAGSSWRHFDPRRDIDRQFKKLAARLRDRRPAAQRCRDLTNPAFAPLCCYESETSATDFYLGFCPATRRFIHVTYHRADPAKQIEDQMFRDVTMPGLCDQPLDAPSRWAIFDVSFIGAPGLELGAAKLDLGDMRVELWSGRAREAGPSLGLREIYPAQLALARQPMEAWLRAWFPRFAPVYMPRGYGFLRRRPPQIHAVQTARGPGVTLDLHLRWIYRVFFRKAPRTLRLWLFEDKAVSRLVGVSVGAVPDQLDAGLDRMLEGLHWAGIGG